MHPKQLASALWTTVLGLAGLTLLFVCPPADGQCVQDGQSTCSNATQCCGPDVNQCHSGVCCNWLNGACTDDTACCGPGNICNVSSGLCKITVGNGWCTVNGDCSSNNCDLNPVSHTQNHCLCGPSQYSCLVNGDCCLGNCHSGTCCQKLGASCQHDSDCCSDLSAYCSASLKKCASKVTDGNLCTDDIDGNGDNQCINGECFNSYRCVTPGDAGSCTDADDCATGSTCAFASVSGHDAGPGKCCGNEGTVCSTAKPCCSGETCTKSFMGFFYCK
jgi:hypothetical protein